MKYWKATCSKRFFFLRSNYSSIQTVIFLHTLIYIMRVWRNLKNIFRWVYSFTNFMLFLQPLCSLFTWVTHIQGQMKSRKMWSRCEMLTDCITNSAENVLSILLKSSTKLRYYFSNFNLIVTFYIQCVAQISCVSY